MERINLTKYGFIRSKEEDFNDDGTRFYCYRLNRIRVTKASGQGNIYISASLLEGNLNYKEYSLLPHYKYLDKLNGVDASDITEKDLEELYNNCVEYEKEYCEMESNIVYPTKDEIVKYLTTTKSYRESEYEDIVIIIKNNFEKLLELDSYGRNQVFNELLYLKNNSNELNEKFENEIDYYCNHLNYARDHITNNPNTHSWEYNRILSFLK